MGGTHCYPPFVGPSTVSPSPAEPPLLLPLRPHPGNVAPGQPTRELLAPPPTGWVRTFHAAPAAYPRSLREEHGTLHRHSHPFGEPEKDANKEARNARLHREVVSCVDQAFAAHEWSLAEAEASNPPGLFLAIERWRRVVPSGGATVVCTHANGMQKEHWHPALRRLLTESAAPAQYGTGAPLPETSFTIDDIWIIDDATHGASIDLNAGLIGPCETWDEVGRDVLNFLLHVLPAVKAGESKGESTPWQLSWTDGLPLQRVIGFGSSFGGVGHLAAAMMRPDVFSGLFLVDPLIRPDNRDRESWLDQKRDQYHRIRGALKRRDNWPSREAARESLLALPFYRRWDPEIVDLTVSHGMVDAASGGVELATPRWAEAAVFCETAGSRRCWDRLAHVVTPTGFFMADKPTVASNYTQQYVWMPPLARNERCPGSEHLVLQENPAAVADAARRFLQTLSAGQWGRSTEEIRASYGQHSPDSEMRAKL